MASRAERRGPSAVMPVAGANARVTPLELFFDLLFVFAFTQVTGLLSADTTWNGLIRGLLVLSVLWWTWAGYARLTNRVDPEQDLVRIVVLAAVAAMLVVSLALPTVFGAGALMFALGYFVLRSLHFVLAHLAADADTEWRRATFAVAPNAVLITGALVAASRVHGDAQLACWVVAALVSYGWPLIGHARGWEVSPTHFVERFGLIILIALGEAVVAIGAGASGMRLDASVVAAALAGMTVIACLWWSYFDWVMYVAGDRLGGSAGPDRAALARDAYAYLHSAMVTGIVLFAYGVETALHDTARPLGAIPSTALAGGVSLYFLAHVALRLRIGGGLGHGRPVAAIGALILIPVATVVDASVTLSVLALLCVALIAYEVLRHRDDRAAIRAER
jgi:low temperature requirement protein LtrA